MNRSMRLFFAATLLLCAPLARLAAAGPMPWSEGPIPIRFKLERPGYVTLVIEDAAGVRVRNLLAEEKFNAGEQTVYWDGADGSDVHLHKQQGQLVAPGTYTVRGLVRDELKLIYEFAVYNPGNPPWEARDKETGLDYGRWLSDHNSASGALYLPNGSPAGKQPQLMFCAGGGEAGPMWTMNSNMGAVHIGTIDGLYVATVMRDHRKAGVWPATIKRGDNVIEYTNGQESFGVSLNPLDDGRIIMSVGGTMIGLCRLEGLETVKRLPSQKLTLAAADTQAALDWRARQAAGRPPAKTSLAVRIHPEPRALGATPTQPHEDAWQDADWAPIETGKAGKDEIVLAKAAMAVFGDRLHVVWVVPFNENPLNNSAESLPMLFKTGSALDVMLGAGAGSVDQRLLVSARPIKGKGARTPIAVRYRPKSPTGGNKTPFSSPWRTIEFDDVADVSADVQLGETYLKSKPFDFRAFEISIPLATLGLKPASGTTLKGDLGLLRGSAGNTSERLYWHNKATGLTADVPGEAMLQPELWGEFKLTTSAAPAPKPATTDATDGPKRKPKSK